MSGLNDNHKSHLRITFAHVDELLSKALRELDPAEAESPFSRLVPDAAPVQRKVAADYAARVRAAMRNLLDRYGIELPKPHIGAVWAARTVLTGAEVALQELSPAGMRGYGPISDATAADLDTEMAQLLDLLRRMAAYLAQGTGRDLQARLERLENTPVSIEALQALARIVTAHGLVEFRPMLETLVERLESPVCEIAVFGRVKTGKSSLLNYLLKTEVLPVGVTPITAVPTRIGYGPEPFARVGFAEAPPETIALDRLAEFATEQRNPANIKHVARLQVEIPSPLLEGIVFVDTPGVGSLAASGAAEAMAYLPRCDLGLVLVDSGASLNPEDVALVDALHRSGAGVRVLLSKADLLAPDDRRKTAAYVRRELAAQTGLEVPVDLISTRGAESRLCDRWVMEVLAPALRDHRRLAELSLRRKLGGLRKAVQSLLERRLALASGTATAAGRTSSRTAVDAGLSQALAEWKAARLERLDVSGVAAELAAAVVDEVAHGVVERCRADPKGAGEVTGRLEAAIARKSADLAATVNHRLGAIRAALSSALRTAADELGLARNEAEEMPKPANLPVMDNPSTVRAPLQVSTRGRWLGGGFLYRSVRRQLTGSVQPEVLKAFARYGQQLEQWRQGVLADLGKHYSAQSEFILAQASPEDGSTRPSATGKAALENDLEILRQWDGEDISRSNKLSSVHDGMG